MPRQYDRARGVRVLRVIPTIDPHVGGPSHSAVNAAIAEGSAGVSTTFVFAGDTRSARTTEAARGRLAAAGVTTHMFRRRERSSHKAGRWGVSGSLLWWLVRNVHRHDVVHVHYVWAMSSLIAIWVGRFTDRLVVLTAHESLTQYDIDTASGSRSKRLLKLRLRTLLLRRVDIVVCASELELADSLQPGERGIVIAHPVVETPLEQPFPLPKHATPVIGYLGRLHPKKGIDVLLRAVTAAANSPELEICGDGDPPYRAELVELAEGLGLSDRVTWRGHVAPDTRRDVFARADIMVMASTYECFGMAGAEAMACGVPIIVSRTTGLAGAVEAHRIGAVVEPGDVDGLAGAIDRLIGDSDAAMRSRALAASSALFSFAAYAEAIGAVYRGDEPALRRQNPTGTR